MEKFLIDANIILGLLNKKDEHHEKCLKFFQEIDAKYKKGEKIQGIVPLHLAIEVNINIRKRKKNKTWDGIPPIEIIGPIFYPIDQIFLQRVQQEGLYGKFSTLKSADAIYAMISFLEKIPFITLDNDFNKVKDIIEVKIL
ncbi:hypothetical protein COS81_03290 [candidate division WWE3 bacterium CG06_land_8_20_14_3_00_42_16]|uniref:PIN domain-containing protein n=2 Tax=Katanobacteria TaxID=422282 RepID=A0A2M7AMT3_UNCKA|nr:MAG: hypothetical protein COS81_03290 [candidate division WWE3 bacterium CG06_land_8_20_14_3_00_42_16]PJC69018.1 MAG: hypothetical protein CO015_01845 [candidate division WWE3 bacterium CG_4_8_14_3_um_filter_42_11]